MNPDSKLTLILNKTVISTSKHAFEAFIEPAEMSQWFTTSAKADLRVGGKYSNADGDRGEFLTLDPPREVAFTWENSKHCPGTVVTVSFTSESAGMVLISLEHSGLRSQADYEDMQGGWSWALDSFKSYVET